MSIKTKIDKNAVSLAGEFAVLSQLYLQGFDASMVLGHTKGIDILVFNPANKRTYQLEVKTNFQNSRNKPHRSRVFGEVASGWIMNKKHETINSPNLFYCFVNIDKQSGTFKFYVIPSVVVSRYVRAQHRLWLSTRSTRNKKTSITDFRNFRIGYKEKIYPIKTPTIEEYENNWTFKR